MREGGQSKITIVRYLAGAILIALGCSAVAAIAFQLQRARYDGRMTDVRFMEPTAKTEELPGTDRLRDRSPLEDVLSGRVDETKGTPVVLTCRLECVRLGAGFYKI